MPTGSSVLVAGALWMRFHRGYGPSILADLHRLLTLVSASVPSALVLLAAVLLASCGGGPPTTTAPASSSDGEWIDLFDGETLDGWHGYNRTDVPGGWSAEDGAIRFTPGSGDGGDLMADGTYDDFELELEWRVAECGNSGVFYWTEESPAFDVPWRTALEMQVLDDSCHPDAQYPSHTAGALYDLYVPTADVVRSAGEWNRTRIVARSGHIEHWLNGQRIVEAEPGSEDWDARVAASKFRDGSAFPAYGTRTSGAIGLQDHGDAVWYRNVRVRRL